MRAEVTTDRAPGDDRRDPSNRLKVVLGSWDDEPALGGQGVYVRELRRALESRGVKVTTVAGRGPHAMEYRRLTGRGHLDQSIALNLSVDPLLTGGPELVHLSGGPGGLLLLHQLPVPLVYTAHHTHRQSLSHPLRRVFAGVEARSYRRAQMVIAVSPSTADSVVAMGVSPERVRVISPGITPPDVPKDVVRDPQRLLFVGRLHEVKGPLDAVAAMHRVCETLPGASGAVIGDGPLSERVRAAVACGSAGRLEFLGRLSDEGLAAELARAAVVLVPSLFEGLGMVALEAMACGAVVVGYDVEGLHDTVGDCGVLVRPGDVSAMAAACVELIRDDHRREELAEYGRRTVRSERSWERCSSEVEETYREVLAEA